MISGLTSLRIRFLTSHPRQGTKSRMVELSIFGGDKGYVYPIPPMGRVYLPIFTIQNTKNQANVAKYATHGWYGYWYLVGPYHTYRWSYKPYKWPKINGVNGVITLLKTSGGPICTIRHWKITIFNKECIFKRFIFHCHVSLLDIWYTCLFSLMKIPFENDHVHSFPNCLLGLLIMAHILHRLVVARRKIPETQGRFEPILPF